jgi:H+/Cl- antiporter ClcA
MTRAGIVANFRREFGDRRRWLSRAIVLAFAALAGITVVGLVWLTDRALAQFSSLQSANPWLPLAWTPLCTAAIVWFTRRYAPGAAGSGIPQVMAALEPSLNASQRGRFVSVRLSVAKFLLTGWGLLAGLSLGREGPSVQVAAGVMQAARRWLPVRSAVSEHGLLVAGGAAGIAAAFNAPLAGVMFAIEELSRNPEQRNSGLIISAIVLAGLIAVSVYGNDAYFGVIQVQQVDVHLLFPGVLVALASGVGGGSFAYVLIRSLAGQGSDVFSRFRRSNPVAFAAACGLAVAIIGVSTDGATFGSGYAHSKAMLSAGEEEPLLYAALKYLATWLTAWSGVPGGIFAPSLAIGGALGNDVSVLTGYGHAPTLIALGMAGFLAAATQAPLTAFIIVMEMVDGHAMVLSLMACTLIASAASRAITRPLYGTLAGDQLGAAAPGVAAGPVGAGRQAGP